ncbi:MAG: hypothetical protein LUQ59_12170, partial [Methanothrix sp.]|nr:hypothetical protein [Methanothrix sp.]
MGPEAAAVAPPAWWGRQALVAANLVFALPRLCPRKRAEGSPAPRRSAALGAGVPSRRGSARAFRDFWG